MASIPSPTWVDSVTATRPILGQRLDIDVDSWANVFRTCVDTYPDHVLYVTDDDQRYTMRQFHDLSWRVAKSLVSLGLAEFDTIAIHGFNAVEWFAADVGASLAACVPAGIYTTNKADIVAYILNHSVSRVLFIDDDGAALEKVLSVAGQASSLLRIVVWGANFDPSKYDDHPQKHLLLSWDDFLTIGDDISDDVLEQRLKIVTPESACKLIYTSGTTGPPKAVIVSQDNVQFTARLAGSVIDFDERDRIVSYLPVSHIAANTIDIAGAVVNRLTAYLADRDALRGSLVRTLRKARPTVLLAVPRVFEKMHEGLLKAGAGSGFVRRAVVGWAKGVGRRASASRDHGDGVLPWGYTLADYIVFGSVRKALGLDAAKLIINSSAPLQQSTDAYFKELAVRIVDLYGMSEATGPFSLNHPEYRAGTSGKVFPGIELKLVRKTADNEGELCFRGRNMFMGYLGNPDESAKTMDDEGFVRSGDIGRVDADGFITITGRAKELLITAGGENVAPVLVESTLVTAMPALARAVAIGDQRKFVSALVIPHMDDDGRLIGPAASVSCRAQTAEQAADDPTWKEYLTKGIEEANRHAISQAAKVKAYRMLTKDFSVDTNELTPSLKVKRKVVVEKFADVIDSIYN